MLRARSDRSDNTISLVCVNRSMIQLLRCKIMLRARSDRSDNTISLVCVNRSMNSY